MAQATRRKGLHPLRVASFILVNACYVNLVACNVALNLTTLAGVSPVDEPDGQQKPLSKISGP